MSADINQSPNLATDVQSRPSASPSLLPGVSERLEPIANKETSDDREPQRKHHTGKNSENNNSNNHRNKRRRRGKQQNASPPKAPLSPAECSVCNIAKDSEPPKYKCPKCRATYCSVACCRKHKEVCPGKVGGGAKETTNGTETTKTEAAASTATVMQDGTPQDFKTTDKTNSESETEDDSDDGDDSSLEDGWEITDEMKVALRNSSWLRSELQDGGLRDMITSVVRSKKNYRSFHKKNDRNSRNQHGNRRNHNNNNRFSQQKPPPHPHEELAAKRAENKNFDIFIDKLLVLSDVLERQDRVIHFENGEPSLGRPSGGGTHSTRNEEELEEWLRMKWDPEMSAPALALRPRRKAIPKFEPVESSSESDDEDENEDE